jgi:hypothetical protein
MRLNAQECSLRNFFSEKFIMAIRIKLANTTKKLPHNSPQT